MKKISVVQTCANCRFMGVVLTPPWPEMCNKNYDWQKKIHPARNAWCIDFVPMFQPGKFLYLDYAPLPLTGRHLHFLLHDHSLLLMASRSVQWQSEKGAFQPWETVYVTNRFQVAMRLFSNRSQRTSLTDSTVADSRFQNTKDSRF